jgi:hypothetical protein
MATRFCANCGQEVEGRMTERCAAGGTHRFARIAHEQAETTEREANAKKREPVKAPS